MVSNVEKSNVEKSNFEESNVEESKSFTKHIEDEINKNNIVILKFDNLESKYNNYFHKFENHENLDKFNLSELNLSELNFINIVDDEIIDFYGITNLPSIFVYKQKNLMDFFEGYFTQSEFIKKIKYILSN